MGELFVGKSYPRMDRDKVTGRAAYITDIRLPRMLYGKILYSTRPHARITSIDTSKAEKLHGVRAVLTGFNTPDVRVGFLGDQTPLKKDKVRQFRDEVAAVAAIDEDIAEEAISLIKVEYEDLPAVFDPIEAMKKDAPLVHEFDARGKPRRNNILPLPWKLVCRRCGEGPRRISLCGEGHIFHPVGPPGLHGHERRHCRIRCEQQSDLQKRHQRPIRRQGPSRHVPEEHRNQGEHTRVDPFCGREFREQAGHGHIRIHSRVFWRGRPNAR